MDEKLRQAIIVEVRKSFPDLENIDDIVQEVAGQIKEVLSSRPDRKKDPEKVAIRRSKILVARHFNVDLAGYENPFEAYFFDTTTPVLKAFLDKHVKTGSKVLEIGTGHIAVNSIYLAKRFGKKIKLVATDIDQRFIETAKRIMRQNNVSFPLYLSNLLQNPAIGKGYDVIFFNPPYVQSKDIKWHGSKATGDGGDDGLNVVRKACAELPSALADNGVLGLGFNTARHSSETIPQLIKREFPQLTIHEEFHYGSNTAVVYVLKKRPRNE